MMQMNIHEILKHLPHRYPFVLIDGIEDLQLFNAHEFVDSLFN